MKAVIVIMGKKYEGEGETIAQAISNIPYAGFARFKALLTVGDKTKVLTPVQTMKLFSKSPLMKEIALKQTALRF